jgi:hypothetical protein
MYVSLALINSSMNLLAEIYYGKCILHVVGLVHVHNLLTEFRQEKARLVGLSVLKADQQVMCMIGRISSNQIKVL